MIKSRFAWPAFSPIIVLKWGFFVQIRTAGEYLVNALFSNKGEICEIRAFLLRLKELMDRVSRRKSIVKF